MAIDRLGTYPVFHVTAITHRKDAVYPTTSEIAIGSKLGIDATKKLPGEGFKRPWSPLIKMDESVRKKMVHHSPNNIGKLVRDYFQLSDLCSG